MKSFGIETVNAGNLPVEKTLPEGSVWNFCRASAAPKMRWCLKFCTRLALLSPCLFRAPVFQSAPTRNRALSRGGWWSLPTNFQGNLAKTFRFRKCSAMKERAKMLSKEKNKGANGIKWNENGDREEENRFPGSQHRNLRGVSLPLSV